MSKEAKARIKINNLLEEVGWILCDSETFKLNIFQKKTEINNIVKHLVSSRDVQRWGRVVETRKTCNLQTHDCYLQKWNCKLQLYSTSDQCSWVPSWPLSTELIRIRFSNISSIEEPSCSQADRLLPRWDRLWGSELGWVGQLRGGHRRVSLI